MSVRACAPVIDLGDDDTQLAPADSRRASGFAGIGVAGAPFVGEDEAFRRWHRADGIDEPAP